MAYYHPLGTGGLSRFLIQTQGIRVRKRNKYPGSFFDNDWVMRAMMVQSVDDTDEIYLNNTKRVGDEPMKTCGPRHWTP